MKKIAIRLSYLGINFYGSQKQKGLRTIQGVFETYLSKIYNQQIKVSICSRLDKDVSADDFLLTYELNKIDKINHDRLKIFLSKQIGDDVKIKTIQEVPLDFSARYSCSYKIYSYRIQNENINPLYSTFSLTYNKEIDLLKIEECLSLFKGVHDFYYFASLEYEEKTIQKIDECYLKTSKNFIEIKFKGKSFLKYQVRFMVGAIFRYLENKITLEDIQRLLNKEKVIYQRLKMPGKGLILEKIHYPFLDENRNKV